jgi:hypothetical protein
MEVNNVFFYFDNIGKATEVYKLNNGSKNVFFYFDNIGKATEVYKLNNGSKQSIFLFRQYREVERGL